MGTALAAATAATTVNAVTAAITADAATSTSISATMAAAGVAAAGFITLKERNMATTAIAAVVPWRHGDRGGALVLVPGEQTRVEDTGWVFWG